MTSNHIKEPPSEPLESNLISANDRQLDEINNRLGIGLSLEEMKLVKGFFIKKGRNPTYVELQGIGQTWSEHCFHKTFKGDIASPEGKLVASNLLKTYIAKATHELNLPWCISVFEDNAGIIEFEKDFAIAAKVETHNHPSAIEPFGGAATGVGGVIRDILGVWADPVACTDVLCFGPLGFDHEKLPQGVKHPNYLFRGVTAGIGHYGNNMGIPTVNGAIYFDESYVGNVIVYCGCIGILPTKKFTKDTKPGDMAVLAGGRTGRDGIHGVTFASAELTRESEAVSRPAVQIANPIEEEKLKRAIVEIRDKGLGSAITDLGGGGFSCAIGEMAYRSGCGVWAELERIPLKYPGMAAWEVYVSESQERMLLSVRQENLDRVLSVFESEGVEASAVGVFTGDGKLRVTCHGHVVVDLDLDFLYHPPRIRRVATWTPPVYEEPIFSEPTDLELELLRILSSPNVVSRESVIRTYDHEVKGNTALKPLQGKQGVPNDSAVIKPLPDSWKGLVISCGINPYHGKIDPYWMTASAIDEALRNNVSVGGRRIALLDNFVWGNPEKQDRMGQLLRACQACYDFSKAFGAPFISGKDSLYNESPLGPVTPTLLITAIGVIPDIRLAVSSDAKKPGDLIYIVGQTYPELGGSEYYKLKGFVGRTVPKVRAKESKKIMTALTKAIDAKCIRACHDLSEGGLALAAAEMTLGSYGMDFDLRSVPKSWGTKRNDYLLFSESNSRFLVEVPEKRRGVFEALMKNSVCSAIGRITGNHTLRILNLEGKDIINLRSSEIRNAWKKGILGG